jgi:serine/threonine-protein kinase
LPALVVGLGTVAAAAVAAAFMRHATQSLSVPAAEAASNAPPTVARGGVVAEVPSPSLVHLTVHATPPEARLFLDDAPFSANPATGSFPKDGAAHHIRAEAEGYETKHELVVFDTGTMSVEMALDRDKTSPTQAAVVHRPLTVRPVLSTKAPPAVATASAEPPTPPPPSPPPPSPATTKPGLVLDTHDPWHN